MKLYVKDEDAVSLIFTDFAMGRSGKPRRLVSDSIRFIQSYSGEITYTTGRPVQALAVSPQSQEEVSRVELTIVDMEGNPLPNFNIKFSIGELPSTGFGGHVTSAIYSSALGFCGEGATNQDEKFILPLAGKKASQSSKYHIPVGKYVVSLSSSDGSRSQSNEIIVTADTALLSRRIVWSISVGKAESAKDE